MQTIEINTTQNVIIRYELASVRDRTFAFIIDFIIMMILIGILLALFGNIFPGMGNYIFYIVLFPVFLFYTLVSEIINQGQSLGKKALGIKVVKLNGKEPVKTDYILRWSFRMVDIYLSFGSLAFMLISSSSKGQRLGDLLSHTTVIKLKPDLSVTLKDITNINTLENYQPKYPEVRRFSEDDMILVKTMIDTYRNFPNKANREAMQQLLAYIKKEMGLKEIPKNEIDFLKTLIKDYIVLTR